MKKYILFDHDGVLVDTEPFYCKATLRALDEIGIKLDLSKYLDLMADGISNWVMASEAGISDAVIIEQKAKRNAYYQVYLQNEDIEITGVEAVLTELGKAHKMAIVTTAKKQDFELIHRHRTITSHMEFILASGDYSHSKPHPAPYLTALRRFNAEPHEAIIVEDSARGLKSALAAGIDCVVVRNEFTSSQDFTGAFCHIGELSELIGLLS